MQPSESKHSPDEVAASAYYECQVPQLPRRTKNVPRFCVPSARGPVIDQQSFNRFGFFACQGDYHGVRVKGKHQGINRGLLICALLGC